MNRIAGRVGWAAQRAGWIVAVATLVWCGPLWVGRVLGLPLEARLRTADGLPVFTVPVLLTLAGLSTSMLSGEAERESSWRRVRVLVGGVALALLVATTASNRSWLELDAKYFAPAIVPTGAMLVVVADTIRRARLPTRELVLRTSVASGVTWLVGVWFSAIPSGSWSCLSPPASAELAALGAADGHAIRALFGLIATACSASVLLACPSRRERLPLVGLGAWMASRSVVELVAHHVASGLRSDGSLDSTELATLAALARVVGVTGYAVASGCWILAATQRVAAYGERSATRAWSSLWPLLPVLLLSTSAAFEPHLTVQVPQQSPEAVWTEVSDVEPITWTTAEDAEPHGSQDVPLLLTRVENVVAGVLTREGELHLFRGGRHESLDREHVLDPPSDTFWPDGVELVVDRRATLGDLRRAARHLRLAAGLSVVWRSNRLHEASPSARERWAFVEMSARALRARRIDLVDELDCDEAIVGVGPRARRSCLAKPEEAPLHADEARRRVMQIESPDDVLVRDWLVANADTRETFALLVPKTASTHERLTEVSGRERPEDPLTRRVRIPDLGEGLLLGVLFALFGAFVATHARMRRSKRPGSFATLHCVWLCVPWVLTDGLGGPYRAHDTRPDEAAARHELRVVVRRVAEATMDGARRWVFVAVLACAIGFGLPLLLAK